MYKSIFSLSFSFLLVSLTGFITPGQAQISVNSSGKVIIGTTSGGWGQPQLYVRTNQGSLTHNTGIRAHASGSAWNLWGLYGIADGSVGGGGNHHRGLIAVATGGSSSNYGIYASASGTNSRAGYFNGDIYYTGSLVPSDEGLKKDIASLRQDDILTLLSQLDPKRYRYLTDEELRRKDLPTLHARPGEHFGLLAQELEAVFPQLVAEVVHVLGEDTGEIGEEPQTVTTKAVNYQELTVLLLAAVQELQERVQSLEQELDRR